MELSDGFRVREERGVWHLEHVHTPGAGAALIRTLEGCGDARDAAQTAANYLRDVALEINQVARDMPADAISEDE